MNVIAERVTIHISKDCNPFSVVFYPIISRSPSLPSEISSFSTSEVMSYSLTGFSNWLLHPKQVGNGIKRIDYYLLTIWTDKLSEVLQRTANSILYLLFVHKDIKTCHQASQTRLHFQEIREGFSQIPNGTWLTYLSCSSDKQWLMLNRTIAECCLSYANIAFLSEKNISFKYYYKKIRGFHYVFLQKVRGFLCAFCKKVRGFDKNIETKCTQPSPHSGIRPFHNSSSYLSRYQSSPDSQHTINYLKILCHVS